MKDDINKKAFKAGVWYTICSVMVRAVSFLSTPIFTRILTKSDIGYYANLSSWISLLAPIITLDLYTSVNLAYFDLKEDIDNYISSILVFSTGITLIFYIIFAFNIDFFCNWLGIEKYMLHIMFVYLLVYSAQQLFSAKCRIFLNYWGNIFISILSTVIGTISALICTYLFTNKLQGRIFGYYGILICVGIFLYINICVKSIKIRTEYWKYGLKIALPMVIHVLAGAVLSSSDRVMIKRFCGLESTAMYSIAYTIGIVISVLWTSINQAFAPWVFEMLNLKKESAIKSASKPLMIFFGIIILCVLLAAPEILWLMGGKAYEEAIYAIPPIVLGYVSQFVYTFYVNIEIFNKKQKQIMTGTLIAALINLVLNFIFIPIWGYVAAAYTTFIGYFSLFVIHFLFVRRMKKTYVYDTRFIFIYYVGIILISVAMNLLYRFNILRYGIIAALGAYIILVFILNNKLLIADLKKKNFITLSKDLIECIRSPIKR